MQDIRCGTCSRKLGEGEFVTLTIKCTRCKTMNHLRATRPEPDRHRATRIESAYGRNTQSSTSKERLSIP
ncbi:Com family DNA-binding transcriptional regulator [Undibacterium sp. Di27W]|uniref:Com family DNA-binding transcriptional regulator n=1 Tax=Undibacterium sp. Di27W TaxID=3413036 RepID=UPI003BEFFB55